MPPDTGPAPRSISIVYDFPAPTVSKDGQFDAVTVAGLTSGGVPGCPELPTKGISLLVPYGYVPGAVSASGIASELGGKYSIRPAHAPVILSKPDSSPAIPDAGVYSSDCPYPYSLRTEPVVSGFRGFTIVSANICPVQYNPTSGRLQHYSHITVAISLEKCQSPFSSLFRGLQNDFSEIESMVDNPWAADMYPRLAAPWSAYDLLIVTTASLKTSFQELASWKENMTVRTRIATVEDIESSGTGKDTQDKIRNYIIDEYKNNGITYVILGGDVGSVPYRGLRCDCSGMTDDIPSDLYFGCLDGTWDKNGDGIYGDTGEEDWNAEVYVGRLPADTTTDVSNIVHKIKTFEGNDRNTHITLHGGYADAGVTTLKDVKEGNTKTGGIGCHDYIPAGYIVHTLYEPDNGTTTVSDWEAQFYQGRLFINHGGHGMETLYSIAYYPSDGYYGVSEAQALTNTVYPVQATVACLVGAFEYDDCLAEAFVNSQGGCSAVVMNSRYGLYGGTGDPVTYSGELDIELFKQIFSDKVGALGKAVQKTREGFSSKIADTGYKWVIYCWNLIGDPTQDMFGAPKIHVTSPNGGENWYSSTNHDITWTSNGGMGTKTVTLEYSTTGAGGTWTTIATGEPDDGSYSWSVPTAMSANCFVRATLQDSSSPPQTAQDASDAAFTITQPHQVTLSQPNGGETLKGGSAYQVKWSTTGGTGLLIDLFYSTDSGTIYSTIAASLTDSGSYSWTVPAIDSSTVRVRAKATNSLGLWVNDSSDADFSIDSTNPAVTVLAPTTGTIWAEGSHRISWTVNETVGLAPASLNISYSPDDGATWSSVTTGAPPGTSYWDWVPSACPDSTSARIKVSVADRVGNIGAGTSGKFTLDAKCPTITHAPALNAGKGEKKTITADVRDDACVDSVILFYTDIGGSAFNQVPMTGTGSTYSADIPAQSAEGALKYHIFARDVAGHWVIEPKTAQMPSGDNNHTIEIKDTSTTGSVSGTVRDGGGSAVKGAVVTSYITGTAYGSAMTDSSGKYTISGLDPGTYDLVSNATGYYDGSLSEIAVTAGSALTGKDITMYTWGGSNSRTLSGRVLDDASGSAVAGADVTASLSGSVVSAATTDASGNFSFGGLAPGTYTVNATKTGYGCKAVSVPVLTGDRTGVELRLSKPGAGGNGNNNGNIAGLPMPLMIGIIVAIIAVVVITSLVVLAAGRRRKKEETARQQFHFPPQQTHHLQNYLYTVEPPPSSYPVMAPPAYPPGQNARGYGQPQQHAGQMKTCKRCGSQNETWRLSCQNCRSNMGGH